MITDYGCRRLQELGAYRHKQNLVKQAQERQENKSDTLETMLASSRGLMQGVMSLGFESDKTSCAIVRRGDDGRPAAKSCENSLLGKIIQLGRSQTAADDPNGDRLPNIQQNSIASDSNDVSHCSAAKKLGEIGDGKEQDVIDIQSPDVFLVPMDTEESDVDMTTPLCEEEVKLEFPAVTSRNAASESGQSSSTDSAVSSRPNSDLMCLDSGGDSPRKTGHRPADPDLRRPASPAATDRPTSTFPLSAAGELKWPKSASLDYGRHPNDANELRKVKSESFQHPPRPTGRLRRGRRRKNRSSLRFISSILLYVRPCTRNAHCVTGICMILS